MAPLVVTLVCPVNAGHKRDHPLFWQMGVIHLLNRPEPLHFSPVQDSCYASEPCPLVNSTVET